MLRTVIIDDESVTRETLVQMLRLYCPQTHLVGEAGDIVQGVQLIERTQPDLVMLDIKMPGGTGFDLLKKLNYQDMKVIFISAYEDYALKAFRFHALDYLLKPIDPDDLTDAVNAAAKGQTISTGHQVQKSMPMVNNWPTATRKIALRTQGSIHLVDTSEIIRCESDRNYTRFHFLKNNTILVSKTLKDYDQILGPYGFMRVHKSHLVNLNHILCFDKRDGGFIIMRDGSEVPVASRKRFELLNFLEGLDPESYAS